MQYRTLKTEVSNKITINRSDFITTLTPVTCEENAIQTLAAIRKKYGDATHNCYAYVGNVDGTGMRFSDDGEPSGTAAAPMLEVLKKKKLTGILAVVTRYYGGIKLGSGGLIQAYVESITAALEKAEIIVYELCDIYNIEVSYSLSKVMQKIFAKDRFKLLSVKYEHMVKYEIALASGDLSGIKEITDLTLGGAIIDKIKEKYLIMN